MSAIETSRLGGKAGRASSVFVLFDDPSAQERATSVCHFLTTKFCPDLELELHWCDFQHLNSGECAQSAVNCASSACFVVIATAARKELPQAVLRWLDDWSQQRHGREGTLIALIESSGERHISELADHILRRAAHQAGLDYLTHEPEFEVGPLPDEQEWINMKEHQMGSVLGKILETPIAPS